MPLSKLLAFGTAFALLGAPIAQGNPTVVASIKPIHSLVSSVMAGIGKPFLLVEAGSPHTYSLKPSQARHLQNADAIFWVAHDVETFLEKPLATIAQKTKSVELGDADGLLKLKFREGGFFDEHDEHDEHDDHDKSEHDDHEKNEHDEHDKNEQNDHEESETDDKHDHGAYDPHSWLDPANAKVMVDKISTTLAKVDPANREKYEANARKVNADLDKLIAEVSSELDPTNAVGYIVFHDAYQYFENRFRVPAVGSVTISPEKIPGAKRVKELRDKVRASKAKCIYSEPQFEPKILSVITEGTKIHSGILDPLGAELKSGPSLYFELIRNMTSSLQDCFSS